MMDFVPVFMDVFMHGKERFTAFCGVWRGGKGLKVVSRFGVGIGRFMEKW